MKHPVKCFNNPKVCLKALEPFIRDGEHLQAGKPFKQFGEMRSREILANNAQSYDFALFAMITPQVLCTCDTSFRGLLTIVPTWYTRIAFNG